MNEIAAQQQQIGDELSKLLSNAKKESIERRTKNSIEKRRKTASELWTKFKKNHKEAKSTGVLEHNYFTENFYMSGEDIYLELEELLNSYERLLPSNMPYITATRQTDFSEKIGEATTKIATILDIIQDSTYLRVSQTESELKWKLQRLTDKWEKLTEIHESISVDSTDPYLQYYRRAKTEVDDTIRRLFEHMDQMGQRKHRSIPDANIPVFTGKYEEWSTFYDLFNNVVHSQVHLSKVEKFQYLKTRIRGEPFRLIRNLSTTEDNYDAAWRLLKNRYDNKRLLTYKLLDQIVNFPKMNFESAIKLKDLHDTIEDCTSAIANLKIDTSGWETILDYLILSKWDKTTTQLFEQAMKSPNEIPDHKEVMKFMVVRFQSLEATGKNFTHHNGVKVVSQNCQICKHQHTIEQCNVFKNMSL